MTLTRVDRRTFLRGAATTAVVMTLPLPRYAGPAGEATFAGSTVSVGGSWVADQATKTIRYVGPSDHKFTMHELYRWTQDRFDDADLITEEIPMIAVTPTMFEMTGDWTIDESCPEHLTNGSLAQGEEVWSSIVELEYGEDPKALPLAPHEENCARYPHDYVDSRHPGVWYVPVR